MKNSTGLYPRLKVDGTYRCSAAGQAGGVLLTDTIRLSGLGSELSIALVRWRKPTAVHDPAKVILDLAVTLALGGDCLAALAVSRLIELSAGWSIARFVKTLRRSHRHHPGRQPNHQRRRPLPEDAQRALTDSATPPRHRTPPANRPRHRHRPTTATPDENTHPGHRPLR